MAAFITEWAVSTVASAGEQSADSEGEQWVDFVAEPAAVFGAVVVAFGAVVVAFTEAATVNSCETANAAC